MTGRVFAFRPEPGLSATIAAGREAGLDMVGCPLFAIAPLEWDLPAGQAFDGLLVGSANVFRCAGGKLAALYSLPAYTVGRATAQAAADAGFAIVHAGSGSLQAVLDGLGERRLRLLRLGGEERISLDIPAGTELVERVVYRTIPQELTDEVVAALGEGGVVLLHSGKAGERFAALCDRHAIDRGKLRVAALAPRIADSVGGGWGMVAVAPSADDRALLALASDMCNNLR